MWGVGCWVWGYKQAMPQVRPVANLIRLAMQRGLGGSPHERLHQDKESAPLPSRGGFPHDHSAFPLPIF